MRRSIIAVLIGVNGLLLFAFQNCSQKMNFEQAGSSSYAPSPNSDQPSTSQPTVICDPLNPSASNGCAPESKAGLVGDLYYLSNDFISAQSDMGFVRAQTFVQFGIHPNVQIVFSTIDVSPRAWTDGFASADGQFLMNNDGEKLVEWFSVVLGGSLSLPAGDYQLATVSDDGIIVTVDGQTLITDDSAHAPKWDCSSSLAPLTFAADEKKPLNISYWQGPRTQIAMQLFYRPASQSAEPCSDAGGWTLVPAEAFSH